MIAVKKMIRCLVLAVFVLALIPSGRVFAAETSESEMFKDVKLYFKAEEVSMYVGDRYSSIMVALVDSSMLDNETNIKLVERLNSEEFKKTLVYSTSDPDVVCFADYSNGNADDLKEITGISGLPLVKAKGAGSAVLTLKYPSFNKSITCKVTVYDAGLYCRSTKLYTGNDYTFELKGKDVTPVSFKSSDKKIATVDKTTGVVTTLAKGKVTISCKASDGKTYKKKIKVYKSGISQNKIIIQQVGNVYDFTKNYPIIAYGLNVKKWKTSDKKVAVVKEVKLDEYTSIGFVTYQGEGTCTITATTVDGKKYKCKVKALRYDTNEAIQGKTTIVKESTYKKSYEKFYNSIYKELDYGNVIVLSVLADKAKLGNGNKAVKANDAKCKKLIKELTTRYPYDGTAVQLACDTSLIKTDSKKQTSTICTVVVYIAKPGIQ